MFDIFAIGLELLSDWNSKGRVERIAARVGCLLVVLSIIGFLGWVVYSLSGG